MTKLKAIKPKRAQSALKAWETALLLALCVTFCAGMWAQRTQSGLAANLVRLHVIANSDSAADQAEKLQIRDKVLELLAPLLDGCRTQEEAVAVIRAHQDELEALGDVSVTVGTEYYPTRDYSMFSLPAGEYVSLRVTVGQGQGRNWWCVVFPPLCTEALASADEETFSLLSDEQDSLIEQDGGDYELRFRVVEWWGELKEALGG